MELTKENNKMPMEFKEGSGFGGSGTELQQAEAKKEAVRQKIAGQAVAEGESQAAASTGIGSVLGGIIGAIAAGVSTGGMGAPAGYALGSSIGGAVGGLAGEGMKEKPNMASAASNVAGLAKGVAQLPTGGEAEKLKLPDMPKMPETETPDILKEGYQIGSSTLGKPQTTPLSLGEKVEGIKKFKF